MDGLTTDPIPAAESDVGTSAIDVSMTPALLMGAIEDLRRAQLFCPTSLPSLDWLSSRTEERFQPSIFGGPIRTTSFTIKTRPPNRSEIGRPPFDASICKWGSIVFPEFPIWPIGWPSVTR